MKKENIGIGIIGCGYMGRHHFMICQQLRRDGFPIDFIGLCDVSRDRLDDIEKKHPAQVDFSTQNLEELLSHKSVDAVIIATPWALHCRQVEMTVSAGKHIYCEKPIGKNLQEVSAICRVVEDSQLLNQVGLCLRHQPSLWKVKQLVDSGEMGELHWACLREDGAMPVAGPMYRTDLSSRLAGRGCLWEENIHDVDTLVHLFPGTRLKSGRMVMESQGRFEKMAQLELLFPNGVRGDFCGMWHYVEGRNSNRHLELFFQNGVMASDYFVSGDLFVHMSGQKPVLHAEEDLRGEFVKALGLPEYVRSRKRYPWYNTFATLSFLRAIMENQAASPTFEESLAVHQLIEPMYHQKSSADVSNEVQDTNENLGVLW